MNKPQFTGVVGSITPVDEVNIPSGGFYEPVTENTTFTFIKPDPAPLRSALDDAEGRLQLTVLRCQQALLNAAIKYLAGPAPVMASEQIELAIELEKLK